jgi:hypothetical protein
MARQQNTRSINHLKRNILASSRVLHMARASHRLELIKSLLYTTSQNLMQQHVAGSISKISSSVAKHEAPYIITNCVHAGVCCCHCGVAGMQAREKGVDTPSSRQRQQQQQQQSEGLGRMGPLRFRNNRKKAPEVPPAAAAEAATGTKQEGDRAAAGKQ